MLLRYWARLYANPTKSEIALEPAIAALGEPYRAQHPFFGLKHIADFVLLRRKLIIEVDGSSHDTPVQKKKDLEHTIALKALGYEVVRITNEQAQAIPVEIVSDCLTRTPQTIQQLQTALERLRQDYPDLFVPKAKKPKRQKRRRKATRAAGTRGGGRRKRLASETV